MNTADRANELMDRQMAASLLPSPAAQMYVAVWRELGSKRLCWSAERYQACAAGSVPDAVLNDTWGEILIVSEQEGSRTVKFVDWEGSRNCAEALVTWFCTLLSHPSMAGVRATVLAS